MYSNKYSPVEKPIQKWLLHEHQSWNRHSRIIRSLLQDNTPETEEDEEGHEFTNGTFAGNATHGNATEATKEADPMFPKDLFTMEQIKSGAVILYIIGSIYK